MIQTYSDTWKFYVRITNLTARRIDFTPYCMIDTLYDYIESINTPILDIGCGDNNLKVVFPHKEIYGYDNSFEADYRGAVFEDWPCSVWEGIPEFEYGVAINSMHWNDIKNNIRIALKKCKTLYVTLNENQSLDGLRTAEDWKDVGDVKYFWHGQKESTREEIERYLKYERGYMFKNRNLAEDVEHVFNATVNRDPYFGVIRMIISRDV